MKVLDEVLKMFEDAMSSPQSPAIPENPVQAGQEALGRIFQNKLQPPETAQGNLPVLPPLPGRSVR